MTTRIYENGEASFVVPDGQKVAVFSDGPFKVYEQVGFPNYPNRYELLKDQAAGSAQYVSGTLSGGVTIKVQTGAAPAFYTVGTTPVAAINNTSGNMALLGTGGGLNLAGNLACNGATLTTVQIAALTTAAVSALTTVGVAALSTAQTSALTTAQLTALCANNDLLVPALVKVQNDLNSIRTLLETTGLTV